MRIDSQFVKQTALGQAFDLAGVTPAVAALPEAAWYQDWAGRGLAGRMGYLTDRRAILRNEPTSLLSSVKSILCVGKLYSSSYPVSTSRSQAELGWVSRYAWGDDYHRLIRMGLEKVAAELRMHADFEYRIAVDTAPLLERVYARRAGLGWIGKNTCLINQMEGSWFFLGELLLSLELEPDAPPPDRCGTCRRCVDACPTSALVEADGRWELDARRCISYLTIELRGNIEEPLRAPMGRHIFGCDICQDVCPWNYRAPVTREPAFQPTRAEPPLDKLASVTHEEFREMFGVSPILRAKYGGFLRNVCIAMGNSGQTRFCDTLQRLADHDDPIVAEHARWALRRLCQESGV
jgi:epoxyqueuosine reductase